MGLLFIIVVGIVLGLTIFKRLDNSPKPKPRVFLALDEPGQDRRDRREEKKKTGMVIDWK